MVTEFKEIPRGRRWRIDGSSRTRTARRVFRARCSADNDREPAVYAFARNDYTGEPPGSEPLHLVESISTYPGDEFLVLRDIVIDPLGEDTARDFLVTCDYASFQFYGNSNPLTADLDVEWSAIKNEEPVDTDIDGKLITNTAQVRIEGLTRRVSVPVVSIGRYETGFTADLILAYCNTVNDVQVFGAKPGMAYMDDIRARLMPALGADVWRVNYTVAFQAPRDSGGQLVKGNDGKPLGWRPRLPNVGYHYWFESTPDGPGLKAILGRDNMPVQQPWPLNANGQPLPQNYTPDQLIWLTPKIYGPPLAGNSWSDLGFPE